MGRALAERWTSARAAFDQADAALGWSVSEVAWQGPEERLNDTRQTQPSLVATSLACLAALEEACADASIPMVPALVAGHSVGEYAALAAAGVLSAPDAVRLASRRGQLMADASVSGGMAAVIGLDRKRIAEVVRGVASPGELVVANDNAPGQVVISGMLAALERAEPALLAAGARRVMRLKVSGAFHSPLMAPVGAALAGAFAEVPWSDARIPVVSNVTAEPVTDAPVIRELLTRQVSSPVEWVASVRRMVADGVDTFIECGPGAALTGMVRRIAPESRTMNVSDPSTLEAAVAGLRGTSRPVAAEASV
jgi:[acyl-carrier-protein] S-malonyltransferase